jgi:hypothetical protein
MKLTDAPIQREADNSSGGAADNANIAQRPTATDNGSDLFVEIMQHIHTTYPEQAAQLVVSPITIDLTSNSTTLESNSNNNEITLSSRDCTRLKVGDIIYNIRGAARIFIGSMEYPSNYLDNAPLPLFLLTYNPLRIIADEGGIITMDSISLPLYLFEEYLGEKYFMASFIVNINRRVHFGAFSVVDENLVHRLKVLR